MVNVLNAFVGTPPMDGGVAKRAPLGTTMPTTAREDLETAFEDNGAVGPDGISVNPTRSNTKHPMMGGETFVVTQNEFSVEIKIRLMEDDNEVALRSTFGDAKVETTTATTDAGNLKTIYYSKDPLPISSWVFDAVSGEKLKRYGVEQGQVINITEWQDKHDAPTTRELTIEAYPSTIPDYKGSAVVEMRDDGQVADAPAA